MFEKKQKSVDKKEILLLVGAAMMYLFMLAAKNAYNAELLEIINNFHVTKAAASLSTTIYFIIYASMQLILVKLLDKINLKWYLLITSVASGILSLLIPFCKEITQVYVIFALNGFLQASIWPSCIQISCNYLSKAMMYKANSVFSLMFPVSMVLDYGLSALFIHFYSWKVSFWVFGLFQIISTVFFTLCITSFEKCKTDSVKRARVENKKEDADSKPKNIKSVFSYCIFICSVTLLSNIIYYGVVNWMPSLLYDVFGVSSSLSTLITLSIPLSICMGPVFTVNLCKKINPWIVTLGWMLATVWIAPLMAFVFGFNIVLSIILSLVLALAFRSICNTYGVTIPTQTETPINSGALASLVNAFASFGASIGPLSVGYIVDKGGRKYSYLFLFALTVILIVLMVFKVRKIKSSEPAKPKAVFSR